MTACDPERFLRALDSGAAARIRSPAVTRAQVQERRTGPDEAELVARLRAEAHRLGIREINVTKGPAFGGPAWTARVSPLRLKTSQTIRLTRLFKGAVYKEDAEQVVFPIPKTPDLTGTIVDLLRQLVPPGE